LKGGSPAIKEGSEKKRKTENIEEDLLEGSLKGMNLEDLKKACKGPKQGDVKKKGVYFNQKKKLVRSREKSSEK